MDRTQSGIRGSFRGLLSAAWMLFALSAVSWGAQKRTVDKGATSGATYTTINAAVTASQSGDTIYLQGAAAQSYSEAWPANITWALTLMSNQELPDSFPVVTITNWNNWDLNNSVAHIFLKVTLSNCATIGMNNNGTFLFDKVVFKGFNSSVFAMGDRANYVTFSNCVFKGNTGTIFPALVSYNSGPYGTASNCTFYGNTTVSAMAPSASGRTLNIQNSVFSGNTTINSGGNAFVKAAWTYNLLPTSESGYGTGTVYSNSPGFTNGGGSYALISDLNIGSSSPAKDVGTNTGAPSVDITGGIRPVNTTTDMGAYEYGSAGSNYTWTGNSDSDWGTSSNWSPNGVPGALDNIVVDKSGGATIALNGNRSVKGITLGNANADVMTIQQGSSGTLTIASGGSISTNASSTAVNVISSPLAMSANMTATVSNAGGSLALQGVVGGAFALTKSGSGTLTLSGANTFSGGYTHAAGILVVANSSAFGTGTVTVDGTGRIVLNDGVSIANTMTITNCDPVAGQNVLSSASGATPTWSGTINVNKTCTNGGHLGGASDWTGALNLTGPINMGGTATWVQQCDGNVTYGGGGNATRFSLHKGTATLTADNGLPPGVMFQQTHATYTTVLDLNGHDQTLAGLYSIANPSSFITDSSGTASTLTLNGSADTTYLGKISGSLSLVKAGSSRQTLGGTATHTGTTTISAGTLRLASSTALSSGSATVVDATLDFAGYSSTIGSLAGSGIVDNTSGAGTYTLAAGGDNSSTVFSGVVQNTSGTVALTKSGTGVMTLSGTNTYSGATTVEGGSLLVNGSAASSAFTVDAGAILGGSGTVGAIVGNSGTIRPGSNSTKGILSGASADFSGGTNSTLSMRVSGYSTAGTDFDRLSLGGAATLGGSSVLNLDLSSLSGAGTVAGLVQSSEITGTFATVNYSNYSGSLGYGLVYNIASIDLVVRNQAPSFAKGADRNHLEDASSQTVAGWATSISPGPAAEAGQSVTFSVTNSDSSLFSVQPAVASNGTLTYTLAADANGSATVTVVARDNGGTANGGVDSSASQTFTITVTAVNDAPSFTKGADKTVPEGAGAQSFAGWATSIASGPSNESGQTVSFTVTNDNIGLFIAQPAVAANGTLTFTPLANANGTATVTVSVHDDGGTSNGGVDASASQTFTIAVTSLNDAPSFTKGSDKTVLEDAGAQSFAGWATGIGAGPADESGQTVSFTVANDNIGLFSAQPAVAANGTLTFTPLANANGIATVTVVAHDNGGTANGGVDSSVSQTFAITVAAVNDAPSFTKGSDKTVLEDAGAQSFAGWATGIGAGPADESGQTVSFTVANDNIGLFSAQPAVAANGTLTFTPLANANGTATVTVSVHDDGGTSNGGVDASASQTFMITVTSVNDAPSFTKGSDKTVIENAGAQSFAGWATGIGAGPAEESGQTVSFTVANDNIGLFSAQPAVAANGTLTFTPLANANGTATVTVVAHDDGGTSNGGVDSSAAQTFTITVTSLNDAPSFVKGSDKTVAENAGAQSFAGWATGISAGPADESGQAVSFTVSNDDNSLFSAQPAVAANGTLTFTPAADANGTATVTVVAHDDGGTSNGGVDSSVSQTFTITVTSVNDAPSFVKGADRTVAENAGAQSFAGWATGISAGPADESGQTVSFTVANDNNGLFSAQPSVAANGTLTFTPAADANGTATVTVFVRDDGGTASGGVDSSVAQTFTITVTSVNDAPSFTKGADKTVLEDAGAQSFAGWASGISAGPADESGQTVSFTVANDNSGLFSAQPAVAANGTLTFTPVANANGIATVTVVAHDNGGIANGGVDSSVSQTFAITVTAVNDAPSFTKGADKTLLEDAGAQSFAGWATGIGAGPADESGQTVSFTVANDNIGLFSAQPAVAANGTLTFTPAGNANGTATVTVSVHDDGGTSNGGVDASASQTFMITVTEVNDAPSFTKGSDKTVIENAGAQSFAGWATGIGAGPADESGQTVSFTVANDNIGLFSAQPAVAANGTLTFTPLANANGIATVTVSVHDDGGTSNGGVDASASQTFTIAVTSLNDAPSFTKGSDKTVLEDAGAQSFAGWASGISAGPADESGQTVSFTVANDNIGLFGAQPAVAANGTLTFTPLANANGTATVTVVAHDNGGIANGGVDSSAAQTFTITVTSVNDAPSFTMGGNPNILQNAGAQSDVGWATGITKGPADESGQSLGFRVTNGNNALFSAQPSITSTGTLEYTPALNANGSATVYVRLGDNGGTANGGVDSSAVDSFVISVGVVNQAPSFTKGTDKTVLEDAGARSFAGWATGISVGPGSEAWQTPGFRVTNGNSALFSVQPSITGTGELSFEPAPNINGTATVYVRLGDDGGTSNGGVDSSAIDSFTITVTSVNDAPSFVKGADKSHLQNAGAQSFAGWATGISKGPSDESGQLVGFRTSNSNVGLFSAQPSIAANGTLSYTLAANVNGVATVYVRLGDDGGTANGGVDSSAVDSFTITVTAVNQAPSFTKGANQTVLEDAGAQSIAGWATGLSAGPAGESGQALGFRVSNDNNSLFSVQPVIASNGALSYTPAVNTNGSATVYVRLGDDGGTTNGGVDSSAIDSFTITVTSVNDAPSFVKGADKSHLQNAGAQSFASWATGIGTGPSDESGQLLGFRVSNSNAGLFSVVPSIAVNGTLSYTLASNVNGVATVYVRLGDNGGTANGGVDSSAVDSFTITVTAVNQAPSFTKGSNQTVLEDAGAQSIAGWATGLSVGPAGESGQALGFRVSTDNVSLFGVAPSIATNGTLSYTPAANANGSATVYVRLGDNGGTANGGVDSSAIDSFTITVTSVNDAPSFVKGSNQTVLEDAGAQSVAGWATGLSVGPADESGQALGFRVSNGNTSLFSAQPSIATNGTLSYTPAVNANGSATVYVRLGDNGGTANGGVDSSVIDSFTITVSAVNQAPSFTKGANQTVLEDAGAQSIAGWATGLIAGPAGEAGQALGFRVSNDNNSLFSIQPVIASNGTLSYTPAANANGSATVYVRLGDDGGTSNGGVDSSAIDSFTITVTSVNDAPSFVKGADKSHLQNAGAQSFANWATGINKGPSDESGQSLGFRVSNGNTSLFSAQPSIATNGTLSYTPAVNANGSATVYVRLGDDGGTANGGVDSSAIDSFTITVTAVNQAPSFTKGSNQTVLEDAGAQSVAGWATGLSAGPAGEAGQTLGFRVSNGNTSLFSAQPSIASNGTLSYTPAANANGSATVYVRLGDDGGTANGGVDSSAIDSFTITVTSVNDAPSFVKGADKSHLQNAGAQSFAGWATGISKGPSDESGQLVGFRTSNSNAGLFSAQPSIAANGTLSYTLANNTNGIAMVYVRLGDNGGTANGGVDSSTVDSFTISVAAVNQAPSFTKGSNQTVLEDAGAQSVAGWATGLSAGSAGESGQTLGFRVSNSNAGLFSLAPSIASNGTLSYTPAANANGSATVYVRLGDNGGTANGGVDSSAVDSFTITVTSVNDAPSFVKGSNQTVLEDAGAQSVAGWATGISKGPSDESGQSVGFRVSNINAGLFSVAPSIAVNGTLSYTLAVNVNGVATVYVRLGDNGGTANGGVDSSAVDSFTITVTAVNQAPSFAKGSNQTVLEDAGAQSVAGWATGLSAGPAGESGQALGFRVSTSNNSLFSAQPSIASNGTLSYTPAANANASATVYVRLGDNGGISNGGVDSSAIDSFTITVTSVNDAPSFVKGADKSHLQNAGAQSFANWATGINKGPSDESGQSVGFRVSNSNAGLFSTAPSIAANGTLSYTLASNVNGVATVYVRLGDNGGTANGGVDSSAIDSFSITVSAVNQAPSFTKGSNQTVLEDAGAQSVAGWATGLSAGSAGESGQTLGFRVSNSNAGLFSLAPSIASNGTLSYTPAANANGSATVYVRLGDNGGTANGGVDSSAIDSFTITVTSVNDAPSFVKGSNQTVLEDAGAQSIAGWATGLSVGPADESGQALGFRVSNGNTSLFSAQPSIATNGTLSYTPSVNANGSATVYVRLGDNGGTANGGVDSSVIDSFTITVSAVNQAPSFTKGANQTVLEDAGAQSIAGWATGLIAGPAGEAGQALGFRVSNDNNSLFSVQPVIASNGALSYTPAANANGSATGYVRLGDNGGTANGGVDSSAIDSFTITVASVNDAPSFVKGADKSHLQNAGAQSFANWATGINKGPLDESGQLVGFRTSNSNAGLFSAQPSIAANGTLSYTLANNTNGIATVYVRLGDNGGTANGGVDSSAVDSFSITVSAVNQAPSFTKGSNQTVLEDAGAQSIAGWATGMNAGPVGEAGQALGFRVSTSNSGLFAAMPLVATDGTLSYTPAANANGSATVYVRLGDNGGTANGGVDSSAIDSFTITVASVNDAPTFTKGANQIQLQNAGTQSFAGWATGIAKGPSDESGQSLGFRVINGNNTLFTVQPTIASNGTLSYTLASNATGDATVYVRLGDNGGTANGGVDSSAIDSFSITVSAVNQAPSFTKGANQTVLEDAGAQSIAGWATGLNAGPVGESGQALGFRVSTDNASLFSTQPSIASNGTLSYTPAANANGSATVYVRLGDNGGMANGGVDSSTIDSFTITVTSVNDAPSFVKGADKSHLQNAGAQSFAGWATGISKGPSDESGQLVGFRTSNSNAGLFSAQPSIAANGTLSYTLANNTNGIATVYVRLGDNGGTANGGVDSSAIDSFSITVSAVNQAPSFTKGSNQTVLEDAGAQSIAGWATGMNAGPVGEAGQALGFRVSTSNSGLFAAMPLVATDGTLSYTPAANANGSATVYVRLGDNGGTANGGVDSSAVDSFTITVASVNDAPTFTKGANKSHLQNAGAQTFAGWTTGIAKGPADESGQLVGFRVSNSNAGLFSTAPSIAANGTLFYTLASNVNGVATVYVRLGDNGGTANGGVDSSAIDSFTVTVIPVNQAPSYVKGSDQTVMQNSGNRIVANWATSASPGPPNESSQKLSFMVVAMPSNLFSVQPSVSATGTLSFAPAIGAWGTAKVRIRLRDDGGTANGGVDSSAIDSFVVEIRRLAYPKIRPDTLRLRPGDSAAFGLVLRDADGRDSSVSVDSATWSWSTALGRLDHGRLSRVVVGVTRVRVDAFGGSDSATLVVASFDSAISSNSDTVSVRVSNGIWVEVPPLPVKSNISVRVEDSSAPSGIAGSGPSIKVDVVPADTIPMPVTLSGSVLDPVLETRYGPPAVFSRDSSGAVRTEVSWNVADTAIGFEVRGGMTYWLGYDTLPVRISSTLLRDSMATDSVTNMDFTIEDNTADARAFLCLLRAGETVPRCTLVAKKDSASARAAIAKASIPLGATVWMEGRDTRSVTRTPVRDIVVRVDTLKSGIVRQEDRYDLVALPFTTGKGAIVQAYAKQFGAYDPTRWRVFRGDSGFYKEVSSADTANDLGRAFWVRTRRTSLTPWVGDVWTTPVSRPVDIELRPGWNMVGNPYPFDISWQRILDSSRIDSTLLAGPYGYDPISRSWSTPDTTRVVKAWKGMCVFNGGTVSMVLRMPSIAATAMPASRVVATSSIRLGVKAWQSGGNDSGRVWVGIDSGARTGIDRLDNIQPPIPGKSLNLSMSAPVGAVFAGRYFTDVRPPSDSGVSWNLRLDGLQPNKTVNLALFRAAADSSLPVWIQDVKSGRWLEAGEAMDFAGGQETSREFVLLAGAAPLKRADLSRFGLASRARGIAWYLPDGIGRGRVTLELYDLNGRRIAKLVDEELDPGVYARDIRTPVAFGRMVAVLTAGGQRRTLAIVLAR